MRDFLVVMRSQSRAALAERLALLDMAGLRNVFIARTTRCALQHVASLDRNGGIYLLDINRLTVPVGLAAASRNIPIVVDVGDDAYSLAKNLGSGVLDCSARWAADRLLCSISRGVVHRGKLHPLMRNLRNPKWCPDTAPDWLFELEPHATDPRTIATFGSMAPPDATGWVYGLEVADALRLDKSLSGIVVGRGPGLAVFEAIASRELRGRLEVFEAVPLAPMIDLIGAARFITSYQTNDVAGWVRTTGKLPIVLAAGKILITTPVGEAALRLPRRWLVATNDRERMGAAVVERVHALPGEDAGLSRTLALPYRRSIVAKDLKNYLADI